MVQLGQHFKSVDGRNRSDWERLQRQFAKKRVDQDRREKLEDRLDDQMVALAADVVMATELQIQQFNAKLDSYDQATVIALMENQELLDLANARIDDLLARAYVMDDGRRVFKTMDGTQVFDEFGVEVMPDELDFDLIGPERPVHEVFLVEIDTREQLQNTRGQLLEFQEKLDETREQAANGEYSVADLEEMDAELMDMIPPSARANVPGMEAPAAAPELSAAFAKPAAPAQMQNAGASAPAPVPFQ